MCLLTYLPPQVLPVREELRNGVFANNNGSGFAIVDYGDGKGLGRLIIRRSMDGLSLVDEFMKVRRAHPSGPALFHSRLATAGSVDKFNCHPFYVGDDRSTVVAHNGILPEQAQPRKGDRRSDTRKFAEDLLPYRNFDRDRGKRKLEKWLGGDKIVILTVNPRYRYSSYVINMDNGIWTEDDIWHSNSTYEFGYLYTRYANSAYYSWNLRKCLVDGCEVKTGNRICSTCRKAGWEESMFTPMVLAKADEPGDLPTRDAEGVCAFCQAKGTISVVTQVCAACNMCQDCGEDSLYECLCYTPAQLDREVPDPSELGGELEGDDVDGEWPEVTSANGHRPTTTVDVLTAWERQQEDAALLARVAAERVLFNAGVTRPMSESGTGWPDDVGGYPEA